MTSSNAGYLNAFRLESEILTPPTPDESILIDLGNDASYNGASVANPDSNGNFWNSVWAGAFYPDLVNTSNIATQVDFGFDLAGGTDNYNGPAGAIQSAALGALGGATNAVNDYYTSSRFQIQGLNPYRRYNLTFFGSHKFSVNDTTLYSVFSDGAYTQLVARVGLQVQVPESPSLHNSNTVAMLTNLVPQVGNILYVQFEGNDGDVGYLNAVKLDVYIPTPPMIPGPSITPAWVAASPTMTTTAGIIWPSSRWAEIPPTRWTTATFPRSAWPTSAARTRSLMCMDAGPRTAG
jgi:hypothetical protein